MTPTRTSHHEPAARPVRTRVIGLTGAPAAGKSTAARIFGELGARVIDLDRLGHEALEAPEVRAGLFREFGAAAFASDGLVDRAALAAATFAEPSRLARLEALVHPVVRRRLAEALAAAARDGAAVVVIDCALLFEGGLDSLCDETVLVDAAPGTRARRARELRGWTAEELDAREARQMPLERKRALAGTVLCNDDDLEVLRTAVRRVLSAPAAGNDAGGATPPRPEESAES